MRLLKYLALSSALLTLTPTRTSENVHHPPILISSTLPLTREDVTFPLPEIINLYTDCDQKDYSGKKPVFKKTYNEITSGVKRRRSLESRWTEYFKKQSGIEYLSMHDIDTSQRWKFPVARKNHFDNNFNDLRLRAGRWTERHHAIDIFAKVGSEIISPMSGMVIASGNDWKGSWTKKKGFNYVAGSGLGELPGNGAIIFSPQDTSYFYLTHMKDVHVKTGDIVSKGDFLGTVGITGNAIYPNIEEHVHLAYKKSGRGCGIDGTLVSQNPYEGLVRAKSRRNQI